MKSSLRFILFLFLITLLFNAYEVSAASVEECEVNEVGETVCVNTPKGANSQGKPMEASLSVCEDRHAQCAGFAEQGECTKNPGK